MLVWINGPFGVGKTQTAFELRRRLPGSVLADPEEVGFGLHRMIPPELRSDFQDLRSWRAGVVEALDVVLRGHAGPVLVPMTVTRADYFDETVGRLRDLGHDVRHFALLADRGVILHRLAERGMGSGLADVIGRERLLRRQQFAVDRLDPALEALQDNRFVAHVDSGALPLRAVVEHVAASCGLALAPDTDGPVRAALRRAAVGVRHVRFF